MADRPFSVRRTRQEDSDYRQQQVAQGAAGLELRQQQADASAQNAAASHALAVSRFNLDVAKEAFDQRSEIIKNQEYAEALQHSTFFREGMARVKPGDPDFEIRMAALNRLYPKASRDAELGVWTKEKLAERETVTKTNETFRAKGVDPDAYVVRDKDTKAYLYTDYARMGADLNRRTFEDATALAERAGAGKVSLPTVGGATVTATVTSPQRQLDDARKEGKISQEDYDTESRKLSTGVLSVEQINAMYHNKSLTQEQALAYNNDPEVRKARATGEVTAAVVAGAGAQADQTRAAAVEKRSLARASIVTKITDISQRMAGTSGDLDKIKLLQEEMNKLMADIQKLDAADTAAPGAPGAPNPAAANDDIDIPPARTGQTP